MHRTVNWGVACLLLTFASNAFAVEWYVDASASSSGDGSEWNEAFTSLSTALSFASQGDEIFVAQGTYSPGSSFSSTFEIPAGVEVYGGFQNGDAFGEQDPQANPTVLDGGGNVTHVVTLNADSRIDGFTVTAGNNTLNASDPDAHGGGIRIEGGFNQSPSPIINNCIITGNHSDNRAGGIYINTGSPFVTKCTIKDNTALNGAGVSLTDQGGSSHLAEPFFVNCTFRNNGDGSTVSGGAVRTFGGSTIHMHNCVVHSNQAGTGGGSMIAVTSYWH